MTAEIITLIQHKLELSKAVASGAKSVPAAAARARMGAIDQLLKPYGLTLPPVQLPSVPSPQQR